MAGQLTEFVISEISIKCFMNAKYKCILLAKVIFQCCARCIFRQVLIIKQEAHGDCIAHLFSPPKLFEGFCYTGDFILRNLNFLAPRILHAKYQCMAMVHEKKIFEDLSKFSLFSLNFERRGCVQTPWSPSPHYKGGRGWRTKSGSKN